MRIVVQRADHAKCLVDGVVRGEISFGYMLLVGFTHGDTLEEVQHLAKKVIGLRIFEDEVGKLNRSIQDVNGQILAVSQFTLYGDARKGNRPSFTQAMPYEDANQLFLSFVAEVKKYGVVIQTGVFGADMRIEFTNVGPTTIILDSKELM